jgi:hypothetical protein
MMRIERIREVLSFPLDQEYLSQKSAEGWKLVAVEWERAAEVPPSQSGWTFQEVPFGLQVAADCLHLEENPPEMEVLKLLLEMIVQDFSLPRMAEELNQRGYRMRDGNTWGPVAVFKVLPRVIEATPRIHSDEEWATRRKQLPRVAWKS